MVFENKNLAIEFADNKASELALNLGKKVTPFVMNVDNDEYALGYFLQPSRDIKMEVLDRLMNSDKSMNMGKFIFDNCIMKESDALFFKEELNDNEESILVGAYFKAQQIISLKLPESKKNS